MYYKAQHGDCSITHSDTNTIERHMKQVHEFNKLQPSHNSTQLEQDSYNSSQSVYFSSSEISFKTTVSENDQPMLDGNKLTSTVIHHIVNSEMYTSACPSLSKINESDSLLDEEAASLSLSNAYSNYLYDSPVKRVASPTDSHSCDCSDSNFNR